MSHPKISCVLITRLKEYPEIILERLDIGDFFDEILIVNESANVYNRYIAAAKAKNDIIYVQDDDCLVNYQHLFKSYNGRITNTMTKEFLKKYEDIPATLLGWGAFFPKSMLSCFDRYIQHYGSDDAHLLREADRIFSTMNRPWNTQIQPHENLESAQSSNRMGYQENHYKSMDEALEKCKTLAIQGSF